MYKIALLNGKEIDREKAIHPITDFGKFNVDELQDYYNKIDKTIEYDNSKNIKFAVMYEEE